MKKVFEDDIQVAYEDKDGARITTLKKKPNNDFLSSNHSHLEQINRDISRRIDHISRLDHCSCDLCQNAKKNMIRQVEILSASLDKNLPKE